MKFIYFSDSHIKGKTPRYRTGDYFQDIKAKIIEVLKLAVDYNCDTIFCGGDLFDSPLVSLNICDEIIDLIEDCGIDFYCVTGNHDEIGHNPNLSGQTILGHLFKRTKYVKDSSIYEKEDEDLSIEGYSYYHGIENDIKDNGLISNTSKGKKIAIVHAFILDRSFHPNVPHAVMGKFKCNYKLVLLAHWHGFMGIQRYGDTTFIGVGSLGRLTIAKGDCMRQPKVLFVDTENLDLEILEIPAKTPEEAFKLELLNETQDFNNKIDDFILKLEGTKFRSISLVGIIREIAEKMGTESFIVDEINKRIGEAEVEGIQKE